MSSKSSLPQAVPDQKFIQLTRLASGTIDIPLWMFLSSVSDKSLSQKCPSMSWLLYHEPSNKRVIFDLGLPKDKSALTPAARRTTEHLMPINVKQDAYDSLAELELDPKTDIDAVIFSHLHFDHIGDPRGFSSTVKFVVGPGATALLSAPTGWPDNADGLFNTTLFSTERTHQIPDVKDNSWFWQRVGPFEAAHDYFKDGSVYIVNAPGHLVGHINLLVRTREGWVYLAGDTCHFPQILTGEDEAATYDDSDRPGFRKSAHRDLEAAEDHMERVLALQQMGVEVILAHDAAWLEQNEQRFR